jgi:activator of 2-hydroxyglutaryl-CoA dehydratase
MAKTLGFGLDEFGLASLDAKKPVKVNSMCTVFAESEVITLLAKKEDPRSIGLGLHQSIIERISSMLHRIGVTDDVILSGGVGRNQCIKELLSNKLDRQVKAHNNPEVSGALGAALEAKYTDL